MRIRLSTLIVALISSQLDWEDLRRHSALRQGVRVRQQVCSSLFEDMDLRDVLDGITRVHLFLLSKYANGSSVRRETMGAWQQLARRFAQRVR